MSSTNKTAELQLSQFVGTDIPSILTDYNGDMQKIDAGVREVKQATAGAIGDLSSVTARVTNAEQDISGLNTTVQGIATRVVSAEGEIDNLQGNVSQLEANMATAENDIDDIEAVIPSGATANNKLVTNKLTLVESFTRNTNEKLDDYFLRIGSKIKELVDGGNSIKNILVKHVAPASQDGFLTLEDYKNDVVVYSRLAFSQNITPKLYFIPTVSANKEYATIKQHYFKFANSYVPGESTNYGAVTGYEVVTDYTVSASDLGTMQFNVYILN